MCGVVTHPLKSVGHSSRKHKPHCNMSDDIPRGQEKEENQTHNEEKRELRVKIGETEQVLELRIFSPSNVHFEFHRNVIRRKNNSFTSN